MKNILFTCAMEKEAISINTKLQLKQVKENVYRKENITMLITGIGKQRTAISLMKYLSENQKPDLIINIGYAGSTDLNIGEWVNITKVHNYEWDENNVSDYGNQDLEVLDCHIKKLECYSAESFITSTNLKGHIVFDMELHSIALICDMYKIKLLSLKKISDNLNIDKYYENIENTKVMELTSSLDLLNNYKK